MILTCPECTTSYAIPDGAIGADGRKVKCRKCAHVWFTKESDLTAPDDAVDDAPDDAPEHKTATAADDTHVKTNADQSEDLVDEFSTALEASQDEDEAGDWDIDDGQVDSYETVNPGTNDSNATYKPFGINRFQNKYSRIAAVAAVFAFVIANTFIFRIQVVRMLPATAGLFAVIGYPVNLRGLEFQNVTFEQNFENGLPVLSIHGEVVNVTANRVPIPKLRFALRNEKAQEVYYWSGAVDRESLEPGHSIPFTTRLSSPPVTARNIMIRFTDRVSG